MDDQTFKTVTARLKEASGVIETLDPVIREDAWKILRPFVEGRDGNNATTEGKSGTADREAPPPPDASEDVLIEKFESEKEADNLWLTFAILYKRYGKGPFSMEQIRALAKSLHLPLPGRPDTTIRNSRRKAVRKQEGGYKILPGGEKWLKETYGVTKGKQPLPSDS